MMTPITSITGYADILLMGNTSQDLTDEHRGFVIHIKKRIRRLLEIQNDIYDFAKRVQPRPEDQS